MVLLRFLLFCIIVLCSSACTKAQFHKTEMFAEYGPNCRADYYRVTIVGSGKNSQVDYRSGWYDAKSVDSLLGKISEDYDLDVATAKRRKDAIRKTYANYMSALENNKSDTEVEKAYMLYNKALEDVQGVTSLGESPVSSLDHANEKFVIVLSSDPGRVIELIKEKTQSNNLKNTLGLLFEQQNKSQVTQSQIRLKMLTSRVENLKLYLSGGEQRIDEMTIYKELKDWLEQMIEQMEVIQ
ncbi:hypothetical protein [Desulfosarcina variabilis]|uniref:hypothetical protein n=1 Tax=Desulfosarcina variabilis TaxID=2300 RepID=UPI003AFA998D